jgi:hypothetical protein
MADASSQATPFTIIILDGDEAGTVIELEGRSLPYRPLKFTGRQRVKTTWYPGAPVATQQVIGPTEEPTSINGVWKDRYLGNGESARLVNVFDQLRRVGRLVEVRWGGGVITTTSAERSILNGVVTQQTTQDIGTAIVRRGIITKSEFTWDRPQDVAWELEFTWQSRGEKISPPNFSTGGLNPTDDFAAFAASARDAATTVQDFADGFRAKAFGAFNELAFAIEGPLIVLSSVGDALNTSTQIVQTIALLPINIANNVIGQVSSVIEATQQLLDAFETFNYEKLAPEENPLTQLQVLVDVTRITSGLSRTQEQAAQTRQTLLTQIVPVVLAEVQVPAGVDLRDLALQYYGNPDLWPLIANFNGLTSSRVPNLPNGPSDNPGLPIRVPRQTASQLAAFTC